MLNQIAVTFQSFEFKGIKELENDFAINVLFAFRYDNSVLFVQMGNQKQKLFCETKLESHETEFSHWEYHGTISETIYTSRIYGQIILRIPERKVCNNFHRIFIIFMFS